jgi:hypothetical protein
MRRLPVMAGWSGAGAQHKKAIGRGFGAQDGRQTPAGCGGTGTGEKTPARRQLR